MEIECLICKKKISDKNYAISRHMKQYHQSHMFEYYKKYYKLVSEINCEKCGFCDKEAIPIYVINHEKKEFSINYKNGYSCQTLECKQKISLDILGIEYDMKKYEKIGSRSEYISKLNKISIDESKKLKYNEDSKRFHCNLENFIKKYGIDEGTYRYNKRIDNIKKNNVKKGFPCNLENFIKKYGNNEGERKYLERCEKISYSSTLDFFINKYGEVLGKEKFKIKNTYFKISEKSKIISTYLNKLKIEYIQEYKIQHKFVDYYLPKYNMIIEFYGDYWHCNPKKYEKSYYNQVVKLSAEEIWDNDKKRLELLHSNVQSIIIIWESSAIDENLLEKSIKDIENKKTIIII